MPAVVAAGGIPVTADPHKVWSRLRRQYGNGAWRWWRTDANANRDLRIAGLRSDQQQRQKQTRSDEIFHV